MTAEYIWENLEERGFCPTEREKMVLTLRYGLDGDDPKTLEETAQILGVTRERIRQIENKILRRPVCRRRSKKIRDFYL